MSDKIVPEHYPDDVYVMATDFNIILEMARIPMPGEAGGPVTTELPVTQKKPTIARVKMSLALAKFVAMILRKDIKAHEERVGAPITLDLKAMEKAGLSITDW